MPCIPITTVNQLVWMAGLLEGLGFSGAAEAREKALGLRLAAGATRTSH